MPAPGFKNMEALSFLLRIKAARRLDNHISNGLIDLPLVTGQSIKLAVVSPVYTAFLSFSSDGPIPQSKPCSETL